MRVSLTRRTFLQTSAAIVGSGPLLAGDKKPSANDRLHVGVIGVAGQGDYDMNETAKAGAEIVALCDVDVNRMGPAKERHPRAKVYSDFRRMLEQKDLDAVVIATPDHTHATATLAALKLGLHVYCEKPLTHTVEEARVVATTTAKMKRVTQMGTQIHAGGNYRRVVELVQSGAIGAVREVHVWCGARYGGKDRPQDTPPVPKGLDYDLWLGPAPYRPYHSCYIPFHWRDWWDFGGGSLADMACHHMDLPFWALELRTPTRIAAEGPPVHAESAPPWLIVHYDFAARGSLPPVKLTWYHGGKRPQHFADGRLPKWGDGSLFVGEKGMLLAGYGDRKLLPEKEFENYKPPTPFIKDSIGHHKEWVEACKNGAATTCNFDYAGALTEAVLLGNVAYRLGRPLEWDSKNLRATNEADAERYIRKEYRKPWSLA